MAGNQRRANAWRRRLVFIGVLLALWLGVSFGVALFARELSFELFGAPFGVWIAGQGALVVFVGIVCIDVRVSDREERRLEAAANETA
jgi:putative solute:sodium symporter small subunit